MLKKGLTTSSFAFNLRLSPMAYWLAY